MKKSLSLIASLWAMCAAMSALLVMPVAAWSQETGYKHPPEVMTKMLEAAYTPVVSLSPGSAGKRMMAILQPSGLPTIAELAQPEYRLAG